ncbi:MAG: hypothetical protein JWO17_1852 [Actinomycetia bacterium]|nr:hypothetical protein [Actinomycetes bacterium]
MQVNGNSRTGGIGGIAFGVLMFVAFVLASPPGGNYTASSVADFVAKGHRTSVIASLYLVLLAVLGLLALLRELARDSLAWGLGIASAASIAIGWGLICTPSLALAYGGAGGASIEPSVAYTICEGGFVVLCGAGGVLLGLSLLVTAVALRGWVRWFAGVVGVIALASAAWFPFFVLLLGGVVLGIWLLTARREPAVV